MPAHYSAGLQPNARDSLELASLASSSQRGPDTYSDTDSRPSISSSRKLSLEQDDPLDDNNPAARPGQGYGHGRTYSNVSNFDYAANLFPLSSSAGNGYAPLGAPTSTAHQAGGLGGTSLEKHKTLTYMNGLSLIVSLIIGSGIFSSPSQVNANVGSPGAALIVWVIAGVLAWTGAASYAELGGAIPLNGGPQAYLSKILGELSGFLFTWVAVLVLKPGSAAIIAIIMGEYLVRAAIGAEAETISPWVNKGVALVGLFLVTFINALSTRLGTRLNDMFMFLKFIALIGVTIVGIVVALTGFSTTGSANQDWKTHSWFEGTSTDGSKWAVAIYAGLWAYDGWDNTNYVVGEFRNPGRDLPRVIHTAMPMVITSYLLANIAYFFVLPMAVINSTNTVAVMFGGKVFGPIGALILSMIVSASCFGSLNSSTFTSSRLVYAAGKEGYFPAVFGRIGLASTAPGLSSTRTRNWFSKRMHNMLGDEETGLFFTPVNAIVLNAVLTVAYVLVGEFGELITFYGVAGYTFYFLTVLGLIILRVREPNLERPYKTWITTPVIFCCVSLFLLSRAVFAQPLKTLIVIAFVLVGIPVYFWRIHGRDQVTKRERNDNERLCIECISTALHIGYNGVMGTFAIIGAGPCGLSAAKYLLAQPSASSTSGSHFDKVTIYEQQPQVGGVWLYSSSPVSGTPVPQTSVSCPPDLPLSPDPNQGDSGDGKPIFPSPMYETLNTNIPHTLMRFSDHPFTDAKGRTIEQDADLRIFPEREVVQRYLEEYAAELRQLIRFSTSVLDVRLREFTEPDTGREKEKWDVTSRDLLTGHEKTETYDAVVVASGHYNTTYVPNITGIIDFDQAHPGLISHSKTYRTHDAFRGKKVLLVGNSASGLDIAAQIAKVCQRPLLLSVRTNTPEDVKEHVGFEEVAEIEQFLAETRGVRLKSGREITGLDAVLFCTGYLFTFPFFRAGELDGEPLVTDGRKVHGLYKHFLHIHHPTLAFPGLPIKVIPFPFSESQAAVFARAWANELALPSTSSMEEWERREAEEKSPGKYHVFPSLGDGNYINEVHEWITKGSTRGKEPPWWNEKMFWERNIYAQAKIAFEKDGKKARTLEELGFVYEPDKKEEKAEEASSKEPGLDVAG
ncbi:putative Amino acid transporter-like protein [Seiridium cardinale]|uniref:Amino acid transporter-like protein n=1 Tax=Seiridium cardinale TaxID=138064 RepID=A0ABR2X5S3_9PEZI